MKKTMILSFAILFLFALIIKSQAQKEKKTTPTPLSLEETYSRAYTKISLKIKNSYVEEKELEKIFKNGLSGLTKGLDPYSRILTGSKKKYYERMSKGFYGGVGIHLSKVKETLTVLSILPDTPASRTQLRSGDQIIKISGKETKALSIKECSDQLKGPMGSSVLITIRRPAENKNYQIELKRGNISLRDVPYADLVDKKVLYIKLRKFSKKITSETFEAFKKAKKSHFETLILDLRGNTGGLLSSSLKLLDQVLEKDQTILELKGRNGKSLEKKKTKKKSLLKKETKIIVLINKLSASSSEIVAGALQDLDRAIIIGDTSFGKGLVQKIYKINPETSLKITISRYYTPSGRLIQKKNYEKNEGTKKLGKTPVFKTLHGRDVLEKGGITPELFVEEEKRPSLIRELERRNLFLLFAATYNKLYQLKFPLTIDKKLLQDFVFFLEDYEINYNFPGEKTIPLLEKGLEQLTQLYGSKETNSLRKNIKKMHDYYKKLKEDDFKKPLIKKWLVRRLKEKISYTLKGAKEEIKQKLKYDTVFQEALALSKNKQRYDELLKREK